MRADDVGGMVPGACCSHGHRMSQMPFDSTAECGHCVLMVWEAACVWPYAAADAVVHDGAGRAGVGVMPAAACPAHVVGLHGARDGGGVGGVGARSGGGVRGGSEVAAADSPPVQGVNNAPADAIAVVAAAAAASAAVAAAAVVAVAAVAAAAAAASSVAVVVEQRGADDQGTA